MGHIDYTARSAADIPVRVVFTCAKCGKEAHDDIPVQIAGSITSRSRMQAEKLSHFAMIQDAPEHLKNIAEAWEKGYIVGGDFMNASGKVRTIQCPHCHTVQIPDAGCKRPKMLVKWPLFLNAVLVIIWFIAFCIVLFSHSDKPILMLYVTALWIAASVFVSLLGRKITKNILEDPEKMAEKYNMALNKTIYADFTPYGLSKIHVGSKNGKL